MSLGAGSVSPGLPARSSALEPEWVRKGSPALQKQLNAGQKTATRKVNGIAQLLSTPLSDDPDSGTLGDVVARSWRTRQASM